MAIRTAAACNSWLRSRALSSLLACTSRLPGIALRAGPSRERSAAMLMEATGASLASYTTMPIAQLS